MSEETYSFLCPSCSAHLSVPVSAAGVSGPCPYCASTITSPMPHEVPLEDMMAIEEAIANPDVAEQTPAYAPPPVDPANPANPTYGNAPAQAPVQQQQQWNAPSEAATIEHMAGAGIETMEAEAAPLPAAPRQRTGRKKRGERVPKGKKKRDRQSEARPQREEARRPQATSQAAATVVDSAADGAGLSLFAKACLGVAGVALVALGAVYGLPEIMGEKDGAISPNGGAQLLNGTQPPLKTGGMTPVPKPTPNTSPPQPRIETPEPLPAEPTVPVASASNLSNSGSLPEPPPGQVPGAFTDTTLPASMTTYTPAPDSILVKPRQALDNFLAAPNWKERLKYVTGGKALTSEMRSYYTQYPDGSLDPVSVNWTLNDKDPDGTEIFVFTTSFDLEENDGLVYLDFPTVVEGRNGNFTVNWHSFVEFHNRHLHRFVTKRAFNKPQNFHVIALRAHYFGSDSELKSKVESGEFVCVTANSPNPDDGTQAFLSTQNKSGKEMADGLLWEKAAGGHFDTPLVELCWKKTKAGTPYVEITKVLGDKWRDTPK